MFPSLSISDHFTFDFRLHQFSKTNLTQASLRYTSDQRETSFEIQILPTLKFILHIPISLLSLKNWEAVTRILLTVCVSLCATRKYPHVNILRWFAKSFVLPLALSFSPDIDTICHTTLEIDSNNSCWKKLIWIQLDQLKLLDFDSQSNTSSWKLPFKSSVSYPCFWPQNSFFTSQQVSWSLRILKTLSVDAVLLRNDAMMYWDAWRIWASSVRSRDHRRS